MTEQEEQAFKKGFIAGFESSLDPGALVVIGAMRQTQSVWMRNGESMPSELRGSPMQDRPSGKR